MQNRFSGHGLVEIMIAILMIAGSVIALLRFQSYLAYSNSLSNQRAIATQLAVSQIETLRDYSNLTGTNSYANIASGSSTSIGNNATYSLNWTVTPFTNPTYKKIDITVSWTDQQGNAQSIRLINNVAQIDPNVSTTIMAI